MKRIRIGICEDDSTQLNYLKQEVKSYYEKQDCEAVVEGFKSAEELLFQYPSGLPFHCLLLDIGLKEMDGVSLAKQIRNQDKELPIIFITGERDYVLEGYKVGAMRFLLKPYKQEDLAEALSCIWQRQEEQQPESYVGFFYQGEYRKLKKSDILFAEIRGHYLYIKTKECEYERKGSMKQLRQEWNDSCFCLANRSVLVNLYNVERITRTDCELCDGSSVKVSRGCYSELNRCFVEFFM